MRARQERVDAHDINGHPTLDLLLDRALDGLIVVVGLLDLFPDSQEVGLLLREDDHPFLVLQTLQEDVDLVARLHLIRLPELVQRHGSLRLEAEIQDRHGIGHAQHRRADDFTLLYVLEGVLVHGQHLVVLFGRVFFRVEINGSLGRFREPGVDLVTFGFFG